jgi:hypothetical protein
MNRKHPADMTLKTLATYFYDVGSSTGPNVVFPIDISPYTKTWPQRRLAKLIGDSD